jgi:periplasmic protein CpxP/Spy
MNSPSSTTRRWFTSLAALSGLAALASQAQAQTPPAPAASAGRVPSPERMAQAIDHRVSAMVKAADGTPEQKDRLVKLAQAAMADMKPLREQHMAARKKGMDLLAATSIDRNALEQLRAQQMTLADSMSKRMLQHMADAAEVFTPAQRTKLAEHMKQRGERGPGGHGRPGGGGWGGGMGWGGGLGNHW